MRGFIYEFYYFNRHADCVFYQVIYYAGDTGLGLCCFRFFVDYFYSFIDTIYFYFVYDTIQSLSTFFYTCYSL